MSYEVTEGSLAMENGNWNIDGMRGDTLTEFDSREEAEAYFRSCDPRDVYLTEKSCGGVGMRNRGYYVSLVEVNIEGYDEEQIDWKQYTADDYVSEL